MLQQKEYKFIKLNTGCCKLCMERYILELDTNVPFDIFLKQFIYHYDLNFPPFT